MQSNEEEKDVPNDIENIHPDSRYDNWTLRSYDVTTKYEDIPQWMKMYAESSIDTHEFFKFERFEYKELDDWQKMLLKLYREDLRKVIRYYEDYRALLLKEIMVRSSREGEEVSSDTELANRHTVCSDESEQATVSLENKQQLKTLLSLDHVLPIDSKLTPDKSSPNKLSPGRLSPTEPSPSGSSSPQVIRFKRFGHRSSNRSNNREDMLTAVTTHQNKQAEETTEQKAVSHVSTPPSTPLSPATADNETTPKTNGSIDCLSENGSSDVLADEFESPKLERYQGRRRLRGKLHPSLFNSENIDHNNFAPVNDFPSPGHFRSASSRPSTILSDLPSPILIRSASDRPANRHSVHTSMLHGVYHDGLSSCDTLGSDDSFSRDSNKRSSNRVIMSPKMKGKSEPGANNVTVIPDKKEKILTKFLSRATSFGRKDKSKVKVVSRDSSRDRSWRDGPRKSRKDAFVTGPKGDALPKETSV